MGRDTQVVIVAIQLCLMAIPSGILVHGRQFQMHLRNIVVADHGRHVQEAILCCTVPVHEVIPCTQLYNRCYEVTHLRIGTPVIKCLIYLLPFGKTYMHPVGFCSEVPAVQ